MTSSQQVKCGNPTSRDKQFINVAFEAAKHVQPCGSARTVALVVINNRIYGMGHNHRKSHPFQARFAKNPEAIFFHAETHAIKDALYTCSVDDFKKATLYIARARYPKKWEYGLSTPCSGCYLCINTFEIPRIVYTGMGSNLYVEE